MGIGILTIGRKVIEDYKRAISLEWLVANGLGGYSSSTVLGVNTRKYHGLLVAPTVTPPWKRKLLLSKLEEEIVVGDERFHLSANEYPGVIHPAGFEFLKQFRLDPFPTFSYSGPDFLIEKTLFMPYSMNATIANYKVRNHSGKKAKFIVYPLVNSRGIHEVTKRDRVEWGFDQRVFGKKVEIAATYADAPNLFLGSDAMSYVTSGLPEEARWHVNMLYRREMERGYEASEDHYNPGFFELEIEDKASEFNILAAGGFGAKESFYRLYSEDQSKFEGERRRAVERLNKLLTKHAAPGTEDWQKYLIWAADSFISNEKAVIAGYHWFSTWGRDSLICLPGLTLVTGRFDVAKKIILGLIERRKDGMLPSRFGHGWAEYRGADVSLLLFYALHKYLTYTDDVRFAEYLWPELEQILWSYTHGTNENIRMDGDGLIQCGGGMTWMDVKLGDRWVTPRDGKAVEINALWYNALKIMETIAQRIDREFKYEGLPERVKRNFALKFWNPERGCLYDVCKEGFNEPLVRPNQIFAVSLPFQLLDERKAEQVVSVVLKGLLTPYGLRSLERGAPGYKGVYRGSIWERDEVYHEGTVWSWLIGPFITAFIKVSGSASRAPATKFLHALVGDHLMEAGIGTISEVFDGDEPHTPNGCISQAWSVAEILRCYVEDIKGRRPPFEEKWVSND